MTGRQTLGPSGHGADVLGGEIVTPVSALVFKRPTAAIAGLIRAGCDSSRLQRAQW